MAERSTLPMMPVRDDPLRATFDRARAGDGAALDALCVALRPRLYRAAWAVLRDADDADDVAQDALVRAITRRFLFLGRGTVAGWVTRITLNLAKNRARDASRRRELELEESLAGAGRGAVPLPVRGPHEVYEAREARTRLRAALTQLGERQRDVVRLHALADLSFAEVAEVLGITEANARVTFSQAKKKLLAALGSTSGEGVYREAAPTGGAP